MNTSKAVSNINIVMNLRPFFGYLHLHSCIIEKERGGRTLQSLDGSLPTTTQWCKWTVSDQEVETDGDEGNTNMYE